MTRQLFQLSGSGVTDLGSSSSHLVHWDPYSVRQQAYLDIDTKCSLGHQYRLHQMSVWVNLIPKLHMAGASNIFPQHNAFRDDPSLFVGVVRPAPLYTSRYQVSWFVDVIDRKPGTDLCCTVNGTSFRCSVPCYVTWYHM